MGSLTDYLERFPDDYRFYHKLGVLIVKNPAWVATYSLDDPKTYLRKALGLIESQQRDAEADIADIWYHTGRWHMINFEPYDAAAAFRRVCERDPSSLWAWYYAARAYENSHQLRKALECYRHFNKISENDPWSRRPAVDMEIALLHLLLEPTDDHMVAFWNFLERDGPAADNLYNAAVRLEQMHHYDRALELLEAMDQDDRDFDFYILYARIHLAKKNYRVWLDKAMALLETEQPKRVRMLLVDTALDSAILSESWSRVITLAEKYSDTERLEARLNVYAAIVSLTESGDSRRWDELVAGDNQDPAIRFWIRLSEQFGPKMAALRALLVVHMNREDWESAYRFLERHLSIHEPGELFVEEVAIICSATNRYDLAFRLYDELTKKHPDRMDLLNNYGYFLTEAGQNLEKAREMLQIVVENDPNSSAHLDSMGWVYFKMGQYKKAELWLKRALEKSPDDPEQLEHMGDILWASDRPEEARHYWSKAMDKTHTRFAQLLEKLDPGL